MKLEELARTSSAAARTSVAHLDLPPIGEDRRHRSWTTPILAAAGVAALVVAGLVVVDQFTDDGASVSDDDVLPPRVEVPRLALPADSGWEVTTAGTGEEFAGARGLDGPRFTYYGTVGAEDPYADGDLLIASFRAPDGAENAVPPDGDTVELRGTTATVASGVDAGLPGDSISVEWLEEGPGGAVEVVLVSQRLGRDRLLAIAEELTIDTAGATITPGDDLGLQSLASATGTPFDAFRTSTEGFLIGYERGDSSEFLVLSTGLGDIAQEATVLRWWMPEITATTVAGRPAYVAAAPEAQPGAGRPIIWAPADGVVANLTYFGTDAAFDPVATAQSVVELDEATWAALVAEHGQDAARLDEFDEVYGEASGQELGVDYTWVLGLQGDDLCFLLETGGGSTSSCQERAAISPPAGAAVTVDNQFGDRLATVVIAADPAVDDVVEIEGRYSLERVEADGVSWFVAVGATTIQPSFDVVVDGTVVGRVEAGVAAVEEDVGDVSGARPIVDPAMLDALGLGDLEIVLSADVGSEIWSLGVRDDEQCLVLVVEGAPDVMCRPLADLAVFGPFEVPAGERSFVSAVVPPDCADRLWVDGVDLPYGATAGGAHMVWTVAGSTAGAILTIDGDVAGGTALPSPNGTASFPADPCG